MNKTPTSFPVKAILILGMSQLAAWGSLYYAITLLASRIMAETGWSPMIVHGGFSLALVMSAIVGPEVGRLMDRHGGGRIMGLASILAGIGMIIIGQARSEWVYLVGWTLAGASLAGTLYDPAFVTLAQIGREKARAAITTLTLIGGFASTLAWPVTFGLLGYFDWREIYTLYGAVQILIAAPALWLMLGPSSALAARAMNRKAEEIPKGAPPVIRSWVFWLIALSFAINSYVATALTLHLVPALSSLEAVGEPLAVLIGMAFGPAQVAARIVELVLLRHISAFALSLLSFALMPLAMAAMVFAGFSWPAALAATALAGASNGLLTIARGVLPLAAFGRENYGMILGYFVLPARIGIAAAPVTFALLMQAVGVSTSFQILFALALGSFAAMLAIRRRFGKAPD